jgi:hypothetical protein
MSDPEEDPCGLVNRIRVACESPRTRQEIADILGVDVSVIDGILDDPDYEVDPDDYALIFENLPLVPGREHLRGITQHWAVYFYEKPLWTNTDLVLYEPHLGAERIVVMVCDPVYPDRIKSDGPYALGTFSAQQVIQAACEGELGRILTVASYVPIEEYPYPPS